MMRQTVIFEITCYLNIGAQMYKKAILYITLLIADNLCFAKHKICAEIKELHLSFMHYNMPQNSTEAKSRASR